MKLALLYFTTPGKWDAGVMSQIANLFPKAKKVDTVLGWGNLNQDWLEVETEVEPSWGWCKPLCLHQLQWVKLYELLEEGKVLMMVFFRKNGEKLIPNG